MAPLGCLGKDCTCFGCVRSSRFPVRRFRFSGIVLDVEVLNTDDYKQKHRVQSHAFFYIDQHIKIMSNGTIELSRLALRCSVILEALTIMD